MPWRLGLLVILITVTSATSTILTRENVIFQELDIVSTTSSHWKITFISDILPFNELLEKLYDAVITIVLIVNKNCQAVPSVDFVF